MFEAKKELARNLRKNQTQSEEILWQALRDRQFKFLKFRRQHVISGFVVDFYCHRLRLAIELDGKIHEKQKEYDQLRQKIIEEKDIMFLRINSKDIFENLENVLVRIEAISQQKR